MYKKYIILSIVVILVAGAFVSWESFFKQQYETKDWNTYTDLKYGYSIKYPTDWVKFQSGGNIAGFTRKEEGREPRNSFNDSHGLEIQVEDTKYLDGTEEKVFKVLNRAYVFKFSNGKEKDIDDLIISSFKPYSVQVSVSDDMKEIYIFSEDGELGKINVDSLPKYSSNGKEQSGHFTNAFVLPFEKKIVFQVWGVTDQGPHAPGDSVYDIGIADFNGSNINFLTMF